MRNKFARVERILEVAKRMAKDNREVLNRLECINVHGEYVEPGYDSHDNPILLGNWNPIKWDEKDTDLIHRVGEILEKIGCELEWEDEWTECHACGGLVRTEPDCYSWTPSYAIINECELLCHKCLREDAEGYLQSLEDNPNKAVTFGEFNPDDYGYRKVNKESYENGWYGTTDDPKVIAKELRNKGVSRFIFAIDGKGQFNVEFSVWIHESEAGMLESVDEDCLEDEESVRSPAKC